jgi:Bifunctional DNA primase/polymerase, N-terminal/CHC2 zinc finger
MTGRSAVGATVSELPGTLEWALTYAKRGWPVSPAYSPIPGQGCTCRKGLDCPRPGKHPVLRGGVAAATSDQKRVRALWARYPGANILLALGTPSGLVVVDLDREDRLAALSALGGLVPTLTAHSGRVGGRHFYFRHRVGIRSRVLLPGLELRAERAWIVAPPSLHHLGNVYRWVDESAELAPLPTQLILPDSTVPRRTAEISVRSTGARWKRTQAGGSVDTIEAARKKSILGVAERLGFELTRSGKEWVTRCPFHEDECPSLRLNPTKNVWFCDPCHLGGDAIALVRAVRGLGFVAAVAEVLSCA